MSIFRKAINWIIRVKSHPTLRNWILSYFSILLLPIIISSYAYLTTYNIIRNEIDTNNQILLDQIKDMIDSHMKDLSSTSINLQINNLVNSLSYAEKFDNNHYLKIYQLKQIIGTYMSASNIVNEINIYFPHTKAILSSTTVNYFELLPYLENNSISEDMWKDLLLLTKQSSGFVIYGKPSSSTFIYTKTLIKNANNVPLSIIAIELDTTNFINQLNNSLSDSNAFIVIIDEHNNVNLSSDIDKAENFDSNLIENNIYKDEDGNKYKILTAESNISELIYIYAIPFEVYNTTTNSVKMMVLFTIILCILLGLIIISVFSNLNYRPIKKIIGYIDNNTNNKPYKNEYTLIMNKLSMDKNELLKQEKIMRNNIMTRILNGEIDFGFVSDLNIIKYDLYYTNNSFVIGCFNIVQNSNGYNKSKTGIDLPYEALELFIVRNIMSELISDHKYVLDFFTINTELVFILNFDDQNSNNVYDYLENNLLDAIEFCMHNFNLSINVGLSDVHNNRNSLSLAFTEANNSLEYIHLFNTCKVCRYSKIPRHDNNYNITLEDENYLLNLVFSGDTIGVTEHFDKLFIQIENQPSSITGGKYLIYFFYSITIRMKHKLVELYGSNYPKEIDAINDELSNISINEALVLIKHIFINISEFTLKNAINSENNLMQDICTYINSNYTDINLNLNHIANQFNYSSAYISKRFKNEFDESIIDYIYKIRIKHSTELLVNTNLKISDIATVVGFTDSNSLIRIFKKFKGITPGKYKEIYFKN